MIMENEPIRVLHIVPNMQAGGLETLIMNIYRNIDRTKVQFDFLVHYTGNYFYDDEIRSLGGRIYKLSVRDDNNFIKYLKDLDAFFKKHPEYKIVHGHMESLGQFYFKAAKKDGVPVRVAHSHNSASIAFYHEEEDSTTKSAVSKKDKRKNRYNWTIDAIKVLLDNYLL